MSKNSSHKKKVTFDLSKQNSNQASEPQDLSYKKQSNIFVAVRCRPLNTKEAKINSSEIVEVSNQSTVTVVDAVQYNGPHEIFKDRAKNMNYAFDYAFEQNSSQEEVYNQSTKPLLPGLLEGYNASVLAYGATGAGKTYTMLGTGDDPGVMARSLSDLFSLIEEEEQKQREFKLKMNYVEIYNETIRDLLVESNDILELREDGIKGTTIVGVKEIAVDSVVDAFKMLIKGNKNRTTEATNLNATSSRSHAILQISIKNTDSTRKYEMNTSKFILVDLAGSERAHTSKNTGMRLYEGGNINKSLLALGNCINALVDSSEKGMKVFIPWRDSKLTRILKDSLSGNSRVVMIANISPAILAIEDTLNTLKYANRAKNIQVNARKNVTINADENNLKYEKIVNALENELNDLRHQLATKENVTATKKVEKVDDQVLKLEKIQRDIVAHFQEEMKIRKEILEDEKKIESYTLESTQKEYELYKLNLEKNPSQKSTELKNSLKNISSEKEKISSRLNDKYIYQSQLMKSRLPLQLSIKQNFSSPGGPLLHSSYQYYLILLDNMTLEHKGKINEYTSENKKLQIHKLEDQIQKRDQLLFDYNTELKRKNIHVKISENYKSLEQINLEPTVELPLIVNNQNPNIQIVDFPRTLRAQSGSAKKNNVKQVRSFNYELYSNPYAMRRYQNKFVSLNKNSHSRSAGPRIDSKHKKLDLNSSVASNKSTTENSKSFSKIYNEMDKKSKYLLRKNIVGRFKKNLYFK